MRSRHPAQCMHTLQPHTLVGGATFIDNRGCGLIGGGGLDRHWYVIFLTKNDPAKLSASINFPISSNFHHSVA